MAKPHQCQAPVVRRIPGMPKKRFNLNPELCLAVRSVRSSLPQNLHQNSPKIILTFLCFMAYLTVQITVRGSAGACSRFSFSGSNCGLESPKQLKSRPLESITYEMQIL